MTLSHKIAFNTLIQIIGKTTSVALGVIITILIARNFGATGVGTVTFVLVFTTMFGTIADWGLTLITIREASKNLKLAGEIIGNVIVIRLVLAAIAATITIATAIFFPHLLPKDPQIMTLIAVGSLMLLAISIKTSFQMIFNVRLKMENWAISELVANFFILAIVLGVVHFKLGLVGVVTAYLIGDTASALAAIALGFKHMTLKFALKRPETKYLLVEALPMGSILVLFTLYNRVDTLILSYFHGLAPVGLYGTAYKIYEILVLAAAYFANAIMPIISNLAVSDKSKLALVFKKSFVVLFLMGIFVSFANYLFAPLAIKIITGARFSEFAGSVTALQILSLALIMSYFNHLNGYTIIALGKQWYSLIIAVVALAVNIILNLLIIPKYSLYGAAFITFLTEGMIVIFSLIVIKKELKTLPSPKDIIAITKDLIIKKGQIF